MSIMDLMCSYCALVQYGAWTSPHTVTLRS